MSDLTREELSEILETTFDSMHVAWPDVEEMKRRRTVAFNDGLRRLGFVRLTDDAIRRGLEAAKWAAGRFVFLDGSDSEVEGEKIAAFRRAVEGATAGKETAAS